jgi:endonuclease/exonuclease/phosphatase family metal-dependent hydrolase
LTVLRILTLNTHRREVDAAAFATLVADTQPDVVALQEWTSTNKIDVFLRDRWHGQRVAELYLASRYPIRRFEVLEHPSFADGRWGAVARFDLDTPGGLVHVANVHLASPRRALEEVLESRGARSDRLQANSERRRLQAQETVRWLDTCAGPLLLAGDFNTPPESTIYREFWSRYTNAFSSTGLGFGLTYFTRRGGWRIDHILAGPGWRCRRCWVGPTVGSAHRPVIAELAWAYVALE